MTAGYCPFCHVALVFRAIETTVATFQCPACAYVVLIPLQPMPIVVVANLGFGEEFTGDH